MNTEPDMWHGKPERPDRTTTRQTLEASRHRPPPATIWPKVVLIVLLMFGFILGVKLLIGW